MISIKKISRIIYLLVLLVFCLTSSQVNALSDAQTKLFQSGILAYDDTICSSTNSTPGTGAPDGAAFPKLDPTSMANAINKWISTNNSNSKLAGLGNTIVADGQHSNVNPFLIVTIAREESVLSDPSVYNVKYANNSFGRTATSDQPNFQGSSLWYKWTSVQASVDYTAPENQNKSYGGDIAAYIRSRYSAQIDQNNLVSMMQAYSPPDENDTAKYIQNLQTWIGQLVNLAQGNNDSTANTSGVGVSCGGPTSCLNTSTTNQSAQPSQSSSPSQFRQNVVCIAQAQLAVWKSQPGYPWKGQNSYSQNGYFLYSQGRAELWCADFASWVYNQAGNPLISSNGGNVSSVSAIDSIGQNSPNFVRHLSSGYTPKPGDLATYGPGQHVNIVISVTGSTMTVIGGDQGGGGPDGGPYPGGSVVSQGQASITEAYSFISPKE